MDGTDLHIVDVSAGGDVTISDGDRTAVYRPLNGEPLAPEKLRIFPAYVEAGAFVEANCITLTDGEREAVYVPAGQPGMA